MSGIPGAPSSLIDIPGAPISDAAAPPPRNPILTGPTVVLVPTPLINPRMRTFSEMRRQGVFAPPNPPLRTAPVPPTVVLVPPPVLHPVVRSFYERQRLARQAIVALPPLRREYVVLASPRQRPVDIPEQRRRVGPAPLPGFLVYAVFADVALYSATMEDHG